jgi:hypothetical protein
MTGKSGKLKSGALPTNAYRRKRLLVLSDWSADWFWLMLASDSIPTNSNWWFGSWQANRSTIQHVLAFSSLGRIQVTPMLVCLSS